MEIENLLFQLAYGGMSSGFDALKKLEKISQESDVLYPQLEKFISMTGSADYVIRVRGFRLACAQAKWDTENRMEKNLDAMLSVLRDEKPTAVRQALSALSQVVLHKKNLHPQIRRHVLAINPMEYKDTMQGLILKDMNALLREMEEE